MTAIHPRRRAAELCYSPKLAARETGLTKNEVRAIRDLREKRADLRRRFDPLTIPVALRLERLRRERALEAERARRLAAMQAEQERREAIRATLLRAARVARAMGFAVRSSKDRRGRVSSYYLERAGGRRIRISDHEIPSTWLREQKAEAAGSFYNGFRGGAEIIIDCARSATWLRRTLILAEAGRL